ncbi:hypothetical protein Clacol_002330 [Clathrus columnatus]|uniref:Uncharacterized protein n=1 Tax=Clathrus columnatus TaxID=1419009 RepID=A0AAV5A3C2_9AGAM|nr:hypothetical protein Clacol_002330 [Clathrus columnatus]
MPRNPQVYIMFRPLHRVAEFITATVNRLVKDNESAFMVLTRSRLALRDRMIFEKYNQEATFNPGVHQRVRTEISASRCGSHQTHTPMRQTSKYDEEEEQSVDISQEDAEKMLEMEQMVKDLEERTARAEEIGVWTLRMLLMLAIVVGKV